MNTLTVTVVLFALVASTWAGPAGSRVVGGEDALPHQFPHQISLQFRFAINGMRQHFCGASILNESFVLTAAHCHVEDNEDGYVEVVAGEHNLNVTEPSEQRRRVVSFVIHEDYVGEVEPHDVALIKVDRPFEFNEFVAPVTLPEPRSTPTGTTVISGWGTTSRTVTPPMILQTAELPIVPYQQCRQLWEQKGTRVHATNVCAGDLDGSSSTCKGDSGGALVQVVNGTFVQVGISSWAHSPCGRPNAPAVFGGVSNYLTWLTDKMAEL